MTRDEVSVEFTGLAHDHRMNMMMMLNRQQQQQQNRQLNFIQNLNASLIDQTSISPTELEANQQQMGENQENDTNCDSLSTIAILRRHPMYDSLVLIKRYRASLNGYTLEFPTSDIPQQNQAQSPMNATKTTKTTMPAQQAESNDHCCKTKLVSLYLDGDDPIYQCQEERCKNEYLLSPEGEIVHVPMNGLLDRLDNYEKQGITIDSRVYAFAMGLKTAEKFLTTSSIKELQETPPL